MADDMDGCDWYEQGFDSLKDAENFWQCQAEQRGEDIAEHERDNGAPSPVITVDEDPF